MGPGGGVCEKKLNIDGGPSKKMGDTVPAKNIRGMGWGVMKKICGRGS